MSETVQCFIVDLKEPMLEHLVFRECCFVTRITMKSFPTSIKLGMVLFVEVADDVSLLVTDTALDWAGFSEDLSNCFPKCLGAINHE